MDVCSGIVRTFPAEGAPAPGTPEPDTLEPDALQPYAAFAEHGATSPCITRLRDA